MDMDDAEPVVTAVVLGEPPSPRISLDAGLAMPHDDDRMGDQSRLAGGVGDLAEDRIEQERHVVVDDGDDRHRAALADDAGIGIDGDDALALAVDGDRLAGQLGGAFEVGGVVGGDVFGRRAGQQIVGKPGRPVLGFRRCVAFFFDLAADFTLAMMNSSRRMLLRLW